MNIEQDKSDGGGAFHLVEDGARLGELTYQLSGSGEMTIDHTRVDEELRGEGLGEDLVTKAVEFARAKKLRIVPTCPYAKKVIEENADFADVLA